MSIHSASPPSKRIKLEYSRSPVDEQARGIESPTNEEREDEEEDLDHQCSICLQYIVDRTVIPTCSHEFCFECLLVWSEQSRRCPLCSQSIGEYLIHSIRSRYDFRKHYLTPLRTSPKSLRPVQSRSDTAARRQRTARERERDRRVREEREESDKLQRSIEKRRWIYEHDLYAKHVASNSYTRYRPYPSPAQFASSPEIISRTTTFLRRELQIWDNLDVEFLTTFIISLMKSIDIRSESAVKLLAEFLDMDIAYTEGGRHTNAEHFAHEVYSYVRSPFRDLFVYDTVVQYDNPPGASYPPEPQDGQRWRESSQLPSPVHHRPPSPRRRDRSLSWSPSGRRHPSTRERGSDTFTFSQSYQSDGDHDHENLVQSGRKKRNNPTANERNPTTDEDLHGSSRKRMISKGKGRAGNESYDRGNEAVPIAGPVKPLERETVNNKGGNDRLTPPQNLAALPPPDRKRPPRNRSLIETVQAHLKPASQNRVNGNNMMRDKRPYIAEISSDTNSLLREPPVAYTVPSPVTHPSGDQDPNAAQIVARTSGSALMSSLSITDHHQGKSTSTQNVKKNQMSAPEIMARTRARLAKKDESAASTLMPTVELFGTNVKSSQSNGRQDSPTIPLSVPTGNPTGPGKQHEISLTHVDLLPTARSSASPGQGTSSQKPEVTRAKGTPHQPFLQLPISRISANRHHQQIPENHSHVSPPTSKGTSSIDRLGPVNAAQVEVEPGPPKFLNSRTRLLAKLEEEKTLACGDKSGTAGNPSTATSGLDRTFPKHSRRSSDAVDLNLVPSSADSQAMEAKLRTRAQLQVRLAAEKRSGGM